MSRQQVPLRATYSYQNPAFQTDNLAKKPTYRRTLSHQGYGELQEEDQNEVKHESIPTPVIHQTAITMPELHPVSTHPPIISGRQRFRWNLVFNSLVWILCPLPLWLPFVANEFAIYFLAAIQCTFVLIWLVIGILAGRNALILYRHRNRDYSSLLIDRDRHKLRHVVAISCYKEPLDLIIRSVDTLAKQSEVNRISMVISFEERTPDVERKCRVLTEHYADSGFHDLIFTIHPYGVENEIPGKCSNSNYALRQAVDRLKLNEKENSDHVLITTCDADSQFHHHYIAALTYQYIEDNYPALSCIYQPPLFYNWNLDGSAFFTRITGILRSTLMLGALIPFSINTMSIFSFSLSLAKSGRFVHPAYQMDDIICLIRWMGVTGRRLSIRMVSTPVLSGPTSGRTIEIEFMEWARQARRWTIGAAEVFHYFMIKLKRIPFFVALSWSITFLIYYGIILCSSGLFSLSYLFSSYFLLEDVPTSVTYLIYGMIGAQSCSYLVAFLIDAFIPRLLNVDEFIFFLRNIFHFLLTPFVLIGYSLVELYALHELLVRGKKVCKHGASNKAALK